MVSLRRDGAIIVDDEEVGTLLFEENHLEKIEIDSEYQGNGYGTAAIRQFIDRTRSNGSDRITTTPATSNAIIHIFEKLGFENVKEASTHDFLEKGPQERHLACYVKELD